MKKAKVEELKVLCEKLTVEIDRLSKIQPNITIFQVPDCPQHYPPWPQCPTIVWSTPKFSTTTTSGQVQFLR